MIIGGMVGGADGGPFGPPPAWDDALPARCIFIVELTICIKVLLVTVLEQSRLSV
jgi:hypothetical protein